MSTEPLHPFAPPAILLRNFDLPSYVSAGTIVMWVFLAVFIIWALYTAVAVYHWLKYSHASSVAFPAIAVHLGISFILMIYIISGSL